MSMFLLTSAIIFSIPGLDIIRNISLPLKENNRLHIYASSAFNVCSYLSRSLHVIFFKSPWTDCDEVDIEIFSAPISSSRVCSSLWSLADPEVLLVVNLEEVNLISCHRRFFNDTFLSLGMIESEGKDFHFYLSDMFLSSAQHNIVQLPIRLRRPGNISTDFRAPYQISFDRYIFTTPVIQQQSMLYSRSPYRDCSAIAQRFSTRTFTILQNDLKTYISHPFLILTNGPASDIVSHLLSYCGVSPPVAYVAPRESPRSGPFHTFHTGGACNIQSVTKGSQQSWFLPRSYSRPFHSGQSPLVCIEDFLQSIPIIAVNSSSQSRFNASKKHNHIALPREVSLYYMSTLAFHSLHFPLLKDRDQALIRAKASIQEMAACITAFINTDFSSLVISLLQETSDGSMEEDRRVQRYILDLALSFTSDPHAHDSYLAVLQRLNKTISSPYDSEIVDDFMHHGMVAALTEAIHKYVVNPAVEPMFTLCDRFKRDEARVISLEESGVPSLCQDSAKRSLLAAVLQRIRPLDNAAKHVHFLAGLIRDLDLNLVEPSPARGLEGQVPFLPVRSKGEDEVEKEEKEPPNVYVVVDADVYILIYVTPAHLHIAEYVVNHWQKHCTCQMCFAFVKYLIMPLHEESDVHHSNESGSRNGQKRSSLDAVPSLRSVLLSVKQIVEDVATKKDLMVVLVGLRALLSFRQVGSHGACGGLVPFVQYGQLKRYNLLGKVVAASGGGLSFMRAFVGVCDEIYAMLLLALRVVNPFDTVQRLSDSDALFRALQGYVDRNGVVDTHDHTFDMETAGLLLQAMKRFPKEGTARLGQDTLCGSKYRSEEFVSHLIELAYDHPLALRDHLSTQESNSHHFQALQEFFLQQGRGFDRFDEESSTLWRKKAELMGFPVIRKFLHAASTIDHSSMRTALNYFRDEFLVQGKWLEASFYIQYIIRDSLKSSNFGSYRDGVFHQVIQVHPHHLPCPFLSILMRCGIP